MPAIETQELTKKFGQVTAVEDLNLKVEGGEILGLLGPNGAGKTTTLSMLCTLLKPTSGTASVNGFDVRRSPADVRRSIGIVFQDPSLDEQLTAMENLDFHARLYMMKPEQRKTRIEEVLDIVELGDKRREFVKNFSGGMRRRLEIARGLMHHPRVLFLDEPTLGLDPQTRRNIWSYIKGMSEREGVTIILTTHYMEEAEFLCDRIGIIDEGKIIALDTYAGLKAKIGKQTVILEAEGTGDYVRELKTLKGVRDISEHGNKLSINADEAERILPLLFETARRMGVKVRSVSLHSSNLEDVFIKLTGRAIREERKDGIGTLKKKSRYFI